MEITGIEYIKTRNDSILREGLWSDYRYIKRLKMHDNGKTFVYFNDGHQENFKISYNDVNKGQYSRTYKVHLNEEIPKKYIAEFQFLKDLHDNIDWDTYEVAEALLK